MLIVPEFTTLRDRSPERTLVRSVHCGQAVEKPKPLSPEELDIVLQRLPGWSLEDSRIAKEFQFRDFAESLSFVNRLVPYFEQKDHHPDVHIYYQRVRFELSRYDMGGKITDRDIEVAKLIEHEYARST